MRKLLIYCEGLWHRAGIERMTVELANLLCDNYIISIVSIDPLDNGKTAYPVDDRVNIISLNSCFDKSIFSLNIHNIKKLRVILKEFKPDTLITVATPLTRISSAASFGMNIKHLAWEHFTLTAGSRIGAIYKIIGTYLVDKTIVLTERDAYNFRNSHANNIISIPNFTTIGKNTPSTLKNQTLLAVGRHEQQKGFDMLLKAWSKTDIPGWKLRIVGNGSKRGENEILAEQLKITDRVEFADATPNIAEEFKNAGCFVLSSRYEGMVLVLLEAKMMGLPSVSFDCPNGPREIIRDNIDGKLVSPEDIDLLANTLQELLSSPTRLKEMGRKAHEDALIRFSPEAIKQKWVDVIEDLH